MLKIMYSRAAPGRAGAVVIADDDFATGEPTGPRRWYSEGQARRLIADIEEAIALSSRRRPRVTEHR